MTAFGPQANSTRQPDVGCSKENQTAT